MWNLREWSSPMLRGVVFILLALAVCPASAQTQNVTGYDAVYNSRGNTAPSPSFIDASVSQQLNQTDLCATIYNIFTGAPPNPAYPLAGAVIDARGISGSTALTCSPGTTPWNNGAATVSLPSTILLPATGGAMPIIIPSSSPWILPSDTHLIGEGDGIPISTSGTLISSPGTTIQAASGFSGTMIQFGSSAFTVCPAEFNIPTCVGISVENLTLDGQGQLGQTVTGISNGFSQDFSYVNHVSLYRILGTGLLIQGGNNGNANNSGPYSNITFDTGGSTSASTTACAQIKGPTGTRGIHGLTCISENNDPLAAVLLDSSNNSIEDVRIVGFYDGIRVGYSGAAQSNVLMNINGDTDNTCYPSCLTLEPLLL